MIGFANSYIILGGTVAVFTVFGAFVLEPDECEVDEANIDKVKL